jgi:hypothetical protein
MGPRVELRLQAGALGFFALALLGTRGGRREAQKAGRRAAQEEEEAKP